MKRLAIALVACHSDPVRFPDASFDPFPDAGCLETFDDGTGPRQTFFADNVVFQQAGTLVLCQAQYIAHITALHDLTIKGADRSLTVIDAGQAGTTLSISGGATVVVDDVTLATGVGTDGGNVHCDHSTLTLARVALMGGQAGRGGNLFADTCALTISDSEITIGVGTDGLGLALAGSGSTMLTRVTIEGGQSGGSGAGVLALAGSELTFDQSVIANNVSSASLGGGLAIEGHVTCHASAITNNEGFGVAMTGSGALYTSQGCDYDDVAGDANLPHDVLAGSTFDFHNNATFTCTSAGCQ